jgi:iron complex outermembrane receptor protein
MRSILNHKKIWCCFFFLLLISFSSAQNSIIKGQVKDGETVLQAATVSVAKKITVTNLNGEFSIFVNPGTYTLIITHTGYKKFEQKIIVSANETLLFPVNMIREDQMGEVVVLGSRSFVQRSNLNTPVPVDVFLSNKLMQTGQSSLIQMLNFVAPSFNASRQLTNEPVTLRGLDPDHVLILMNGTRYHNMAWLYSGNLKGLLGKGSVGNDLNSIPFSAIEKIEILRDGAAAQYGSDAIAGVINIQLKKSTGKTSINLHIGQFYKGDGEKVSIGFNQGNLLNKKGFLNFSGDFRYQAPTFRGGNYKGTVYYDTSKYPLAQRNSIIALDNQKIRDRGFNPQDAISNVGITQLFSSGILANGGYPIGHHTELFWTGVVNYRKNIYDGAYRFPKNTSQVNTALYPDGFKVRIIPTTWDASAIAGAKGETKKKWHWEFSNSFGYNSSSNDVINTNNASQFALGKNAPTSFYAGALIYNQHSHNLNFAKDFAKDIGGIKSFNLGFGAEWRFENYQIREGEEASWKNYDSSNKTQGGSQGLGGFSPDNAVNKNRNVAGIYVDVESDLNDHFLFNLFGRYEYYSDFGGNIAGKLAARYKFSDKFSLRGAVSNGFRAPSMQQRYFSTTLSRWLIAGGVSVPIVRGLFRNNSDIAQAFGIPSLRAERTVNLNGGFTSKLSPHINLTADAYWIQIKNRVVISGNFDKSNPDVKKILDGYPGIDQVQFFTNAINTRTHGIDVVLNGNWNIHKASLGLTLAANYNRTHIFGKIQTTDKLPDTNSQNTNTLFNIEERVKLEKGQPDSKIILSATFSKGKFGFLFRNTCFGKTATTTLVTNPTDTLYEFFSPKILTDISVNYTSKSWLTITAGANNIFNVYPDRLKNYGNTVEGILLYSNEASPFGFNGGYYFVNMAFNF